MTLDRFLVYPFFFALCARARATAKLNTGKGDRSVYLAASKLFAGGHYFRCIPLFKSV